MILTWKNFISRIASVLVLFEVVYVLDVTNWTSVHKLWTSYVNIPTQNTLRCWNLCRRQGKCVAVTFDIQERICYLHDRNIADIETLIDGTFRWIDLLQPYFRHANITINETTEVLLYQLSYLKELPSLLNSTNARVISNYLITRFVRHRIHNLGSKFRRLTDEYDKKSYGTQAQPARWKTCVNYVNDGQLLGHVTGRMFIEKYFDSDAKIEAKVLISNLRKAFKKTISEATWMDSETKKNAEDKLAAIQERIGFDDHLMNDTMLDTSNEKWDITDDYFGNVIRILRQYAVENMELLEKDVVKSRWPSIPGVVNAFYSPTINTIRVAITYQDDLPFLKPIQKLYLRDNMHDQLESHKRNNQTSPLETCDKETQIVIPTNQNENGACYTIKERPGDCYDILMEGGTSSDVYTIYVTGTLNELPQSVYCDQEADGGGWLVFQRRQDGSEDFYRGWNDYERGFGDLRKEFWIGNQFLANFTSRKNYTLRVDLENFENETRFAQYNSIVIGESSTNYTLHIGVYNGTAGDSLIYHNGQPFTTQDQDSDNVDERNCAVIFQGAWWYKGCHVSNLNGLYHGGNHTTYADGVNWRTWTGYYYSLRKTEMKLRPAISP